MLNDFIGPLRERLTTALEPLVAQLRERLDPLYAQARARYQSLQPRERLLVQIAAGVVGVLILYSFVYQPVVGLSSSLEDRITQRERDLADVRRLTANYQQLKLDLDAAEHNTVPEKSFSLFSVVESSLTKSVGREKIAAITPAADQKVSGGLIQYSVQLKLDNVSLAQVVDVLYGVQSLSVPVTVSSLRVARRAQDTHSFDVDMTCVALGRSG